MTKQKIEKIKMMKRLIEIYKELNLLTRYY
jgi:hypothetical protein